MVGLPPERARVSATSLRQDFALDTMQGQALVNEFVASGLLEPPNERSSGYGLTRDFLELAAARIVEPLPRSRAKLLLTEACTLAERINDEAIHNPLAIDAFAVYGDYMSRSHRLEELSLGVLVGLAHAIEPHALRPMQSKAEGAEAIRAAFRQLSSFVHVRLVTELRTPAASVQPGIRGQAGFQLASRLGRGELPSFPLCIAQHRVAAAAREPLEAGQKAPLRAARSPPAAQCECPARNRVRQRRESPRASLDWHG